MYKSTAIKLSKKRKFIISVFIEAFTLKGYNIKFIRYIICFEITSLY